MVSKAEVQAEFDNFCILHDNIEFDELFEEDGETRIGFLMRHPWGDSTLGVEIPLDSEARSKLASALNQLKLPSSLSAVHHHGTNQLEVIWTANKLGPLGRGALNREFEFQFEGRSHNCKFAESSPVLLDFLKYARPISNPTSTNHRNISSFFLFLNADHDRPGRGVPLSFFIDDFDFEDDEGLRFLRCLNFYMSYYDHSSPLVLVHEDADLETAARERYLHGEFPSTINGSSLDENLLGFWNASVQMPDTFTKYLYCYRILEYSAKNYLDHSMNMALKRALCAPHAASDFGKLTSDVIAVFSQKTMDDIAKMDALVSETVQPDLIWREVRKSAEYFTKSHTFDGGFTVKPLISEGCTFESFCTTFPGHLLKSVRELRNGIAHGKEAKSSATILPSLPNKAKIQPWLNVIEMLAGEVILFRNHV